jgi:hypothetical protein
VNAEKTCKSLDTLPPSKTKKISRKARPLCNFHICSPFDGEKKHCQVGMSSNKATLKKKNGED